MTTAVATATAKPLAALAFALALAAPASAAGIVDDRGRTVEIAAPPQRIVSILPSLAEMVCRLDRCERLVGVDRYTDWPAQAARLPRVGGGIDPNIEAIVALRPDLVLAGTSSRGIDRLESLGIRVLAFDPNTHADVERILGALGVVLGRDDAQRIWREIDDGVSAAARSLPPEARGARVYFEVNAGPYGASEASFIGETLARLGARNILPARLGAFPKLNPEYVVRADPEVIIIGQRSAEGLAQRPGWSGMRAIREGRVCLFLAHESDVLVRPGPRMAEAARMMAECLRQKAPRRRGEGDSR
ncbi:MAG: ABC transporter substrate-binding protein [Lautropia sp. SCN 69-89]|nr:MAG: ABC transporter substrate-binding protein [Lautropia sp. SCN 69-89]